jgi:hypothetical protein
MINIFVVNAVIYLRAGTVFAPNHAQRIKFFRFIKHGLGQKRITKRLMAEVQNGMQLVGIANLASADVAGFDHVVRGIVCTHIIYEIIIYN